MYMHVHPFSTSVLFPWRAKVAMHVCLSESLHTDVERHHSDSDDELAQSRTEQSHTAMGPAATTIGAKRSQIEATAVGANDLST